MIAANSIPQNRSIWLWILLVGVVAIATLLMPWVSTDAAVYLPAVKAIARGQMPYRDFVHNYTPLVPLVFSGLCKKWGHKCLISLRIRCSRLWWWRVLFLASKPIAMGDSIQLTGQQKLYFYTNK